MNTNDIATASLTDIAREVTERLARSTVDRAKATGESIEVAGARVLADFAARWPVVAELVASVTVHGAVR